MKPLLELDAAACAGIDIVMTDIDDTLTSDGRLEAAAYAAIERLHAAGIRVVPVTGRPAGWCDMIARFWPVAAVVGENGAFYFRYDHAARRMIRVYAVPYDEFEDNRRRLEKLAATIVAAVPGAAVSADQRFRLADLAIDFCEDVPPLSAESIDRILQLFKEAGATAKVSSIHVNGWFGTYDKLQMSRRLLAEEFGLAEDRDGGRVLFIGDSPNDEPMFAAIPLSVGVANILEYAARVRHFPVFVTLGRSGAGFVELVDHLLAGRRNSGRGRTP
jgi:HAD superfamily hydrolase (TIGR01484 family)